MGRLLAEKLFANTSGKALTFDEFDALL